MIRTGLFIEDDPVALTGDRAPPTIRASTVIALSGKRCAGVQGILGDGIRDWLDPECQ